MADEKPNEGIFSVRFGPPGNPDREAVDELARMGAEAKPVPVNRNQMIRLAVREYVERHRKGGMPPKTARDRTPGSSERRRRK